MQGDDRPWFPIAVAPKDGTPLELTWMEDGEPQEIWTMQWGHIQKNGLFAGKVGMWVMPCGLVTWNDDGKGGGPTHFRFPERNPLDNIPRYAAKETSGAG